MAESEESKGDAQRVLAHNIHLAVHNKIKLNLPTIKLAASPTPTIDGEP